MYTVRYINKELEEDGPNSYLLTIKNFIEILLHAVWFIRDTIIKSMSLNFPPDFDTMSH